MTDQTNNIDGVPSLHNSFVTSSQAESKPTDADASTNLHCAKMDLWVDAVPASYNDIYNISAVSFLFVQLFLWVFLFVFLRFLIDVQYLKALEEYKSLVWLTIVLQLSSLLWILLYKIIKYILIM